MAAGTCVTCACAYTHTQDDEDMSARLQYCAVCDGSKAPRSHHCRKCGRCVMKMDHHCRECAAMIVCAHTHFAAWINNCVGHLNHASFIRFLLYAVLGCTHAAVILGQSLW